MKPCEAIGFAKLKGIIHSKWRFQSFSSYHIVQRASVDVLFFKNGKNSNPIETLEACDIKGFFKFFFKVSLLLARYRPSVQPTQRSDLTGSSNVNLLVRSWSSFTLTSCLVRAFGSACAHQHERGPCLGGRTAYLG